METISITASEPSRLDKVLSIAGCFAGDAPGIDFSGIKTSDTPILFDGKKVGFVPRLAVQTCGNRLRSTSGKLTDRSFLPQLGNQLFQTGCTLEVLQSDGGMIQKSVLKSFDISAAGPVPQVQGSRPPAARTSAALLDDDEAVVQRIFERTRGCAPSQSEQQPTDRLNTPDSRTDEDIANAIYLRAGGGDQRDPGGGTPTQQDGSQNDDDRIAERLFAASGGR